MKKIAAMLGLVAVLTLTMGLPALAYENDGGYKTCPSGEYQVIKTKTTYFSKAWTDADVGADYGPVIYDWGTDDWKYRYHFTPTEDGWWFAQGWQLSQVWTWSYCD
ncbi:MAG TPA: hypothetical protein VE569_02055 [Acidimicrobiia bacterium]|nr:hypothetical protein [Acidimicrobiia bacterium]